LAFIKGSQKLFFPKLLDNTVAPVYIQYKQAYSMYTYTPEETGMEGPGQTILNMCMTD